jgi:MYXO-CTERM domain-containing protein
VTLRWLVPLLVLFAPALAWAGPSNPQLSEAEANVNDAISATASSDCAMACRALQSAQRAADRVCALDPGAPCTSARQKVADATARVHAACPGCAAANDVPSTPPLPGTTTSVNPQAPQSKPPEHETRTTSAPPSPADAKGEEVQSKKGGCAGCSTSNQGAGGAGLFALVLALSALVRRRKSKTRYR